VSPPKKKKTVLRLHADPGKIRRAWKINPKTRVEPANRKARLEQIRAQEAQKELGVRSEE